MAEHGAHLTSTRLNDPNKPSVFEVLAQESLTNTIRPALKHAVKVFSEKYPAQLGSFLFFYDEMFLVVDSIVQHHFLKAWSASFAENFYGLKRISSGENATSNTQLPNHARLRSLACLVLIPYVRSKLDSWFEDLQYKYPSIKWKSVIQPKLTFQQRMSIFYLCLYPHLRSSWEFISLLYQMSYMLRNGRWHSPNMHLAGVELTRVTDDTDSRNDDSRAHIDGDGTISERFRQLVKLSASTAAACLSYSVSVSVFFLQFLDWWYTTDTHASSLTSLPIPQAPQGEQEKRVYAASGQCPLCMKQRTNSTALSVSGFVFCYPCIHQYVQSHRCCPLTGYPSSEEHLVKIYEQNSV